MLNPKLIIFDLDGVLANTEEQYMSAVSKALIAQGFSKYTIEYCEKNTAGVAMPIILELISQESNKKVDEKAFYRFIEKEHENFENNITIIDGAEEFLKSLQIPFCLASSSSLKQIKRTLTALNIDKYFTSKTIFSCEPLNKYKPNPTVYLEALKNMRFSPDSVIAIEDSISGVKAARGANIYTIGFVGAKYLKNRKKTHGETLLANGAFAIRDNYQDIYKLLFTI